LAFLLNIVWSCNSPTTNVNPTARELNNRAMIIFKNNLLNTDSIQYSLSLLDSAIALQPNYIAFYFNKIELLSSIHDTKNAIRTADAILKQDSMQFNAYIIKGDLFEDQKEIDSARYWYKFALNTIEKHDLMRNSQMIRELQIIKLYYKLGDSINYQKGLNKFTQDYGDNPAAKEFLKSIKN
jgi:tetratricopeptide (TPR) repeat protein